MLRVAISQLSQDRPKHKNQAEGQIQIQGPLRITLIISLTPIRLYSYDATSNKNCHALYVFKI